MTDPVQPAPPECPNNSTTTRHSARTDAQQVPVSSERNGGGIVAKSRLRAALVAAVLVAACACAASPSAAPHSATTALSSHKPTLHVTSGCVLSAATVARISRVNVSQAQDIQMTLTGSTKQAPGCLYSGNGKGTTVLVGISLEPTRPSTTPQQYLAENRLANPQALPLTQQDVPALGDTAKFGTITIAGETIDVVSLVQIQGGKVADLSVTVSGSSVAKDAVIALARAVLAAIYH